MGRHAQDRPAEWAARLQARLFLQRRANARLEARGPGGRGVVNRSLVVSFAAGMLCLAAACAHGQQESSSPPASVSAQVPENASAEGAQTGGAPDAQGGAGSTPATHQAEAPPTTPPQNEGATPNGAAPSEGATSNGSAAPGGTATATVDAQRSEPPTHRGSGEFVAPPPPEETPPAANAEQAGPKLDIAFERAPVAMVVQSLLSDFAGASVVIDPRVTGELTIRSRGQLTAADLPRFLRGALASINVELVDQGRNSYLLRPIERGPEAASAPSYYRSGQQTRSGLVIYGLRHVSATEMMRLLQPFTRQGVTVQAEATRELLVLAGPPDQVASLIETIELFDVDWLAGMSFALVPLEYVEPEGLIAELHTLFGGENGPIGAMVNFVPLPARRSVLVLAKRPERLDQARNWIMQLDRPNRTGVGGIRMLVLDNADAQKVAETINGLFEGRENANVRITADEGRNALLVQADPATFEDIRSLVAQLDAPVDQVVIEMTIAEVTLNNDFRFGVQWSFDFRDGGQVVLSEANNGGVAARFPGFSYGWRGNYVQATLNALSSRTNVEVISSPVIVTLDNHEATLQIGDEVPIITQTATNVANETPAIVNTVQYRETGILLKVTPRIGAGGTITLDVAQEASEVADTTTSGIDSPTIAQRRFSNTVAIADGETVALGGLIRATRTRNRSGVPILSSIPLLGAAFRNTDTVTRRTELLVFMTPRIVRNREEMASATRELQERLGRLRESGFIQRYSPANDETEE